MTEVRPWLQLPSTEGIIVIEEDECGAAYAYLVADDRITADVWLYNVEETPDSAPWTEAGANPPFRNPRQLSRSDTERRRLQDVDDVTVHWRGAVAEISFDGVLEARLWTGAKPGESRMAAADGPIAKRLRTDVPGPEASQERPARR